MTCTLESLARDIGRTLGENTPDDAAAALCDLVETALRDESFLAANIGADKTRPREVLYEHPEKGFCICVHAYDGGANSEPHDHGHTWAIYGQAEGTTEMTDWRIVRPAGDTTPALVEPERTYTLTPGTAHYYAPGKVHSPKREGPTKLLRIEGANLATVKRTPMKPARSAAA